MKKIIITTFTMAIAVIFSSEVYAQSNSDGQNEMEQASIIKKGDMAPNFTVTMIDGRIYTLSELKGKVVLLNFWATWCGPCMNEFKIIPEKIINRFKDKEDFIFLPISREEKRETVEKKMTELKTKEIDFPVGIDPERKIYSIYAKSYIPRNYLIDRDGKIVFASIGFNNEEFDNMVEQISKLLDE